MIWIALIVVINFIINLYIVIENDEFAVIATWKRKTKSGYELAEPPKVSFLWAFVLPSIFTYSVFNYLLKLTKKEQMKNKKKEIDTIKHRQKIKRYQKNNPPKR